MGVTDGRLGMKRKLWLSFPILTATLWSCLLLFSHPTLQLWGAVSFSFPIPHSSSGELASLFPHLSLQLYGDPGSSWLLLSEPLCPMLGEEVPCSSLKTPSLSFGYKPNDSSCWRPRYLSIF